MKHPSGFLSYLHSFRGFAILNIVYIHAMVAALLGGNDMDLDMTDPVAITNEVLFHDSTLYFAIISGLLFTAILQKRGYQKFFVSKLKFVVLPYLFLTIIISLLKALNPEGGDEGFFITFLTTLGRDFIFGKAIGLYWYIPVLVFLYLVTPLLDYIQRQKKLGQVLFVIIMILPLFITRVQMAFEYILSIKTMIYFTGAYAFGMYLGQNLDARLAWIKKYAKVFWSIGLVTSLALFYLYFEDIDMVGAISLRESLFYAQKVCLSAVFILAFKQLGERQPKWLQVLARDSFGIYFLHGIFVFGTIPLFAFILGFDAIAPLDAILGSILITVFSIGISMLLILGFRKLFKKNSRMFIGS